MRYRTLVASAAGLVLGTAVCAAPPSRLAGTYSNDQLTLQIAADGAQCTGTIRLAEQSFPFKAETSGNLLKGTFTSAGEEYAFTASLDGSTLTFKTDGAAYTLKKRTANPLATKAVTNGYPQNAAPPVSGGEPPKSNTPASDCKTAACPLEVYDTGKTGGGLLVYRDKDAQSAKALLGGTLKTMASRFDDQPRILNAMVDKEDRQAEASFETKLNGSPVRGLMTLRIDPKAGGCAGIAYDKPAELGRSLPDLLKILGEDVPEMASQTRAPAREITWQNARFPDGSGTMRLPQGYRVTAANQGAVDAEGPNGECLSLGAALPVVLPQAAGAFGQRLPFVAAYSDPKTALITIFPQLSRVIQQAGQPPIQLVKIIEQSETPFPSGKASFIHYTFDRGEGKETKRYESISLIITAPIDFQSWMLYASSVSAPQETFPASLPELLESWCSWKVNDKVFRDRLNQAVKSMAECTRIIQDVNENRQKTYAKVNADWAEYFRGTRSVENTATGERQDVPLGDADKLIEEANRQAGFNKWRQVKLADID
ncbi:MAG: hypothetical protein ACM359_15440 [Bacillota bacterium]